MIEIFKSIFLGGVQGISEFLPISSSGHLVILPYILKWNYNGLAFDVALHFGTAIAIVAFFWKDWMSIISNAFRKPTKESMDELPTNFFWQIVVATIPAVIVGFVLNDYIDKYFHSPLLIAFDLAFFGIVLYLVDVRAKKNNQVSAVSYKQSFLIGLAQCIALVPGVSRSGITITTGRALGFERKDAAKVSFLLATPAMIGAFLLSAKDISSNDLNATFIVATISATIFGFFAIKYLLRYLQKSGFAVFAWYRILLAIVITIIYFTR